MSSHLDKLFSYSECYFMATVIINSWISTISPLKSVVLRLRICMNFSLNVLVRIVLLASCPHGRTARAVCIFLVFNPTVPQYIPELAVWLEAAVFAHVKRFGLSTVFSNTDHVFRLLFGRRKRLGYIGDVNWYALHVLT